MAAELAGIVEDGDIGAGPVSPNASNGEVRLRPSRFDAASSSSNSGQHRCSDPDLDPEDKAPASGDGELSASTLDKFWHRAGWLVMLLMCQSTSSVILEHFEVLIRHHPVVIYFLTMLVGAGGNAGSQSTVLVVRQLAIAAARGERPGTSGWHAVRRILGAEVSVGARLAGVLFAASFVRCIVFQVRGVECLAICLSMLAITFTSTLVGATLPLLLNRFGLDPAHAGAAIQVIMDIGGVTITCIISCTVLGLPLGGVHEAAKLSPVSPGATSAAHAGIQIQREGSTRFGLNSFGSDTGPATRSFPSFGDGD